MTPGRISIIVAVDDDLAIGRGGSLAHYIRRDLRHFRELTLGNVVVMGRRTFESLPKGALPGRRNIVVSTRPGFVAQGAEVASSLDEALLMATDGPGETFVIGGGSIYEQAMSRADRLCLTRIHTPAPEGADVYFPEIDPEVWMEEEKSGPMTDPDSGIEFEFVNLRRRVTR